MGVGAGLYMYDVVVKKVHVRYLISWWVLVTNCSCDQNNNSMLINYRNANKVNINRVTGFIWERCTAGTSNLSGCTLKKVQNLWWTRCVCVICIRTGSDLFCPGQGRIQRNGICPAPVLCLTWLSLDCFCLSLLRYLNIDSRPSDHYFRNVCLFVQSFSQPSLIRFRSNLDICYISGLVVSPRI